VKNHNKMNRRDFLKKIPAAGATAIIGGSTLQAYANSPMIQALTAGLYETDRVLIVIQLSGGNDGLNTIIPLDQYDNLKVVRANMLMDQNQVLKLNTETGIHPAMNKMADLYKDGKMSVIQGVGYPKFNFSHFRATDIWMTGSDADKNVDSGWASRYLNYEYPNFPVGYPNTNMPDPLAIKMGGAGSVATQLGGIGMGYSVNAPGAGQTTLPNAIDMTNYPFTDTTTNEFSGQELTFVREIMRQTDKFEDVVKAAYDKGSNKSTQYQNNNLANQLKTVARCISGGLKTRIYWLNTGGFDTHNSQVNGLDKSTGSHANLLKGVSDSVAAFMDDVKLLGLENRVMGFTFSEFGRRIKSNDSIGTDHGAAAPMFVFGAPVKSGVLGKSTIIDPKNATVNSNVPMQYDFRSVYASILGDWFCVPKTDLDTVLLKNFQKLDLLDSISCLPVDVHEANNAAGENLLTPYPNPFQEATTLKYETKGGNTQLAVFNNEGVMVANLVNETKDEGRYEVRCDLGDLPAGIYYARLQNEQLQQVKPLLKVK
jgi:uncharacterized protein (DUF1501 family)